MIERAADSKIKKVKKYQAKPGKFIMFFLSPVMRKEKPFFLFDMNYYILNLKNINLPIRQIQICLIPKNGIFIKQSQK